MTTGKTIALTRRTFVGKVMTLLLNMLSRLVIVIRYINDDYWMSKFIQQIFKQAFTITRNHQGAMNKQFLPQGIMIKYLLI